MSQLSATPLSMFSWGYEVSGPEGFLVQIELSWLREGGGFDWGGKSYRIEKSGMFSGEFILTENGVVVAKANKEMMVRRFQIEAGGEQWVLEAASPFSRQFVLKKGTREMGAITPKGIFTRKAEIQLPDAVSVPGQLFAFWLVVLLWRRASNNS